MMGSNGSSLPPEERATLDIRVQRWIETKRGISAETAARNDVVTIGQNPAFEFRRASGLQYRKIRVSLPEGEKSFQRDRKGVATCLFLEHTIDCRVEADAALIISEGEIDALSFKEINAPYAVSVPDGAQLAEIGTGKIVPEEDKPFSWLWQDNQLKPHLAQFSRFILAVDNDRKGRILREELAVRLDRWKCWFVEYPEGCKDANDVLLRHGPDALRAVLDDARPLMPDSLVSLADFNDADTGEVLECGFKGFDDPFTSGGAGFSFMMPELVVITGEPGSGKSEFAAVLGANLARLHGKAGAILQFEDKPHRVYRTIERYAISQVDGIAVAGDDKQSKANARAWIKPRFRTISPPDGENEPDFDLAWIKDAVREAKLRHNCDWVLIDPWNEIEHVWDTRGQTESQYINNALREMKRLARKYRIILFIVAHPNVGGGRHRDIEDADLYGINGGAAWNNKADHGFFLLRPDKADSEVLIKLAKSKDHSRMGRPMTFRYKYQFHSSTYRYIGAYQGKEK